ncbi:MAG TPA: HipA family kinase [Nocardioidaceae bacterium]|nr:HipA family kinase [Nocardioidaceae bacterium]
MIPTVSATRYVAPLREGGSLPGIVEADDLGTYVCKFRGAGQGLRVLVAEVIVGELARRLGIHTPELVAVDLDAAIGKYEADEEVQDLLTASVGLNLGVDFLPGSFGFDSGCTPDPSAAARVIWLDALTANVDRSWRNPNLLVWHKELWAIDHGACLYFHHSWSQGIGSPERFARQPYDASDHVLAAYLRGVPEVDAELAPLVTRALLQEVVEQVPAEWLEVPPGADGGEAVRSAYVDFLHARVSGERSWLPAESAA